jgi:hypothetical protein
LQKDRSGTEVSKVSTRKKLLASVLAVGTLLPVLLIGGVASAHSPTTTLSCVSGAFCVWSLDHWNLGIKADDQGDVNWWRTADEDWPGMEDNDQSARNNGNSQTARAYSDPGFSGLTLVCLPIDYQAGHMAGTSRQNQGDSSDFSGIACSSPNGVFNP